MVPVRIVDVTGNASSLTDVWNHDTWKTHVDGYRAGQWDSANRHDSPVRLKREQNSLAQTSQRT